MASHELVYRLDQTRSLQPVSVPFLEFGPISHEDVLYADVALKPPRVVAVVLLPHLVVENLFAVLLGFVDVILELREVAVDAQVGVSVVHGDIIKNSDCNSELHAKFISLLFCLDILVRKHKCWTIHLPHALTSKIRNASVYQ